MGFSLYSFSTSWLERPLEVNEVYQMVCGMVKDKALGPDGFSMAFLQAYCDVVHEDVMWTFQELFSFISLKSQNNVTIIALNSKIVGLMS